MLATEEPVAARSPVSHYLGAIVRFGAVAVAAIYAIGFALLCAYNARFGIFEFDLLRTRIFLVGFSFVALCALPAATRHYGIAYFGPLKRVLQDTAPGRRIQREIVVSAGFIYTAILLTAAVQFYLSPVSAEPHHLRWWTELLWLALYVALVGLFAFAGRIFNRNPTWAATLAIVAASGSLMYMHYVNPDGFDFAFFFLMIGISLTIAKLQPTSIKTLLDFRNWVSVAVILSLYVTTVMIHVLPEAGGGAPQPATIYLSRPVAWFDAGRIDISLLDETEHGLYVLPSPKGKALLIPDDSVAAVYFGPATDLADVRKSTPRAEKHTSNGESRQNKEPGSAIKPIRTPH